jgi:outer membrane immunogenic protein
MEDFMHCRFLCAGLLASVAAGIGTAGAADFPVRPGAVAPAVAPAYISEWAGFYVGINGGGGWNHTSVEQSSTFILPVIPLFLPPSTSGSGGVFGFQFGHNWQWGPVVGGLEIDFDGADIKETTAFSTIVPLVLTGIQDVRIDELASARGRLGYLIAPNWLIYGTAGIGWGHARFNTSATIAGVLTLNSLHNEVNEFGWVAGAGVEWKLAEHWLLRGEWLHYDFARATNPRDFVFLVTALVDPGNTRTSVDVARAAISYKF